MDNAQNEGKKVQICRYVDRPTIRREKIIRNHLLNSGENPDADLSDAYEHAVNQTYESIQQNGK